MTFPVLVNSIGLFLVFAAHFAVALVVYRRTPEGRRWLTLALMLVGTLVAWIAMSVPLSLTAGMFMCITAEYCGRGTRIWRTYYATIALPTNILDNTVPLKPGAYPLGTLRAGPGPSAAPAPPRGIASRGCGARTGTSYPGGPRLWCRRC
jgi:hypothetical protein